MAHIRPALKLATEAINRKQQLAFDSHSDAMRGYERSKTDYELELAKWKRNGNGDPVPEKPEEPVCDRYIVSDVTIEAVAERLSDQPDGLLVIRDELAGLIDGSRSTRVEKEVILGIGWQVGRASHLLSIERRGNARLSMSVVQPSRSSVVNPTGRFSSCSRW